MDHQTPIQRQIEDSVDKGTGRRHNTVRTPERFRNTEVGLKIALCNMETCDGNLSGEEVVSFSPRLEATIRKFDNNHISLSLIKDDESFWDAFNATRRMPFDGNTWSDGYMNGDSPMKAYLADREKSSINKGSDQYARLSIRLGEYAPSPN